MSRREWYIKKHIGFVCDDNPCIISFIPTIMFQPWRYRFPGCCVFDITWLNLHITIGEWKRKEEI